MSGHYKIAFRGIGLLCVVIIVILLATTPFDLMKSVVIPTPSKLEGGDLQLEGENGLPPPRSSFTPIGAGRYATDDEPCEAYSSCLTCLFTTAGHHHNNSGNNPSSATAVSVGSGEGLPRLRNRCLWCAGVDACVDALAVTDTSKCTNRKKPPLRRYVLPTFKTDIEDRSCPAVMHDVVPANMRVVSVPHRTGGPEALLQLYLALEKWGFRSSFDSMLPFPNGAVPQFFMQKYKNELAFQAGLREFPSHQIWEMSGLEGDVVISADFMPCQQHSSKDIYGRPRDLVYKEALEEEKALSTLLGLSTDFTKDSMGNVSASPLLRQVPDPTYYIPADHNKSRHVRYMLADERLPSWPHCTMLGHTNHITSEYLRQSTRALVFPYASPHILTIAEKWLQKINGKPPAISYGGEKNRRKSEAEVRAIDQIASVIQKHKQNIVIFDNDAGFDWGTQLKAYTAQIAKGFTPDALYKRYSEVRVSADFNVRGGERFIYESGAFGVCVILDNRRNALNRVDFPIPELLRVKKYSSDDRQDFIEDVNSKIGACMAWADNDKRKIKSSVTKGGGVGGNASPLDGVDPRNMTLWEAYEPLRTHIGLQKSNMDRQVRRYFSNSVHVVTAVISEEDAKERLIPFIIATLFQIPFATIEVVFASQRLRSLVPEDLMRGLHATSLLSAVTLTVLSDSAQSSTTKTAADAGGNVTQYTTSTDYGKQARKMATNTVDPWLGVSQDLRETVRLLLERSHKSTAPPLTPSPLSIAPHTSPLMSLYTTVLPLSAATGNEGDYVHYLGAMMSVLSTPKRGDRQGDSGRGSDSCEASSALSTSTLNTELSLMNPKYHRQHLRAINHMFTVAAGGWQDARRQVLAHLKNSPQFAHGGQVDEDDERGQHTLNHLSKLLMQQQVRRSLQYDNLARPACGRRYRERSGFAIVSTTESEESAGAVLGLFWRTSEERGASTALAKMLAREGKGEKMALRNSLVKEVVESDRFFTPIPNSFETLPRVPERTLFGKTATPYTNFSSSDVAKIVKITSSLLVPMREVVSAKATFLGSGHLPIATLPSLRVEPFLKPASSIRSFLCEHEVWRTMVDARQSPAYHHPEHTACPNAVAYEPLIDDYLVRSIQGLPFETQPPRGSDAMLEVNSAMPNVWFLMLLSLVLAIYLAYKFGKDCCRRQASARRSSPAAQSG